MADEKFGSENNQDDNKEYNLDDFMGFYNKQTNDDFLLNIENADDSSDGFENNSFEPDNEPEIRLTDIKDNNVKKKPKVKKSRKILKNIGRVIVSFIIIMFITGCFTVAGFAIYAFGFIDDSIGVDLDDLTSSMGLTTTIYVENKETGEFEEYQRLHGSENRIWVDIGSIDDANNPYNIVKYAFISIEDKTFLENNGINWKRTVGAFANMFINVYDSEQGGSTITQQLVKNLTQDNQQTTSRKLREIRRAMTVDGSYSKDTIIECYLNTIYFGAGAYGIEVASNYYFDKSASELTIVESAALAAIVKDPSKYRPDKYPENNKERRKTVLYEMKEQGYISEAEYNDALNTELVVVATNDAIGSTAINNYFVDALIDDVVQGLMTKYNYTYDEAVNKFYSGGYKIYSTLDPQIQEIMEAEYENTGKYFYQKSKKYSDRTTQSAMTVMDYEGHIVGIVGGAGEKTANRVLNRAWSAPQQPGSTMKPLAAYSLAIEKNLYKYSSFIQDSPLEKYYPSGNAGPKNWYGSYWGNISIQYALERSVNTIPCKLVKEIGVETAYNHLKHNLGLSYLEDSDKNLSSLALGGCSYGITTTQSAGAFAVFGNGGKYYEPTTYTKVTDQKDKVVLSESSYNMVISEETATIMNHLLQTVVYGPNGTGKAAASFSENLKCFAKTGTSSEANDLWFVGGSPYYITSCWYGFDADEPVSPSTMARTLWITVMSKIHKGLPDKEFVDSEFVQKLNYCTSTGCIASAGCPSTAEGWFKESAAPPVCKSH